MAYKIPAKVIRNLLIWGKGHSYDYKNFIKTIRKEDLIKFYSFYRCKDSLELSGTKHEMFTVIEKTFNARLELSGL